MTDFSAEKWQQIKSLAARLQAIKSMLEIFNSQIDSQPFANDLNSVKEQLETDFENTLTALLDLIEEREDGS